MYQLYYTIEKFVDYINGVEELEGTKEITVYEMIDNQPKIFCQIDCRNEDNSENDIQEWLDDNGYEDRECEFILL